MGEVLLPERMADQAASAGPGPGCCVAAASPGLCFTVTVTCLAHLVPKKAMTQNKKSKPRREPAGSYPMGPGWQA